jgi:preprotein translocase subunit SecG
LKNDQERKIQLSQAHSRRFFGVIGLLQIAIIVLVVLTAIIHLQRGISMSAGGFGGGAPGRPPGASGSGPPGGSILQWIPLPLSTLFILNGIGYLVLVIALYLPPLYRFQRLVRWLLIVFAAVTFILYFLVNGFHLQTISIIDKVAEIALIILLLIDDRQSVRSRRSELLHSAPPQ